MSEVETLGYQDTSVLSIHDSAGFGIERYSCGTKQALPCIEKLTGKDNYNTCIGYMLYFWIIFRLINIVLNHFYCIIQRLF